MPQQKRQSNGRSQTAGDYSRAPNHVLITGSTSGLGRALAERYAEAGRTLSLSGRDEARLRDVAKACRDAGANVHATSVDVTDDEAMHSWVVQRDQALPIDILIANAGIGGAAVVPSSSGEDGELARRILGVNMLGVINTVTPVVPRMIERKRGHIVMVGSIQSSIGLPQSPVYSASKAAVQIYAEGLRRLVASRGLRVTLVLPGFVDTPMSRSLNMPRPFCWPAERAAERIISDVARGASRSAFPWPVQLLFALPKYAPVWVTDVVIKQTMRHGWSNADNPATAEHAPRPSGRHPKVRPEKSP
jgi:short-subunit dehydrogenase